MSLALELFQRHDGPLVWGVNDCVQFAAAAVEHYGGWKPVLPVYSTEREALRIIAEGGGLEALVTRALGEPIHAKDAQLGDVVLTVFRDTGPMLGVVNDRLHFWIRSAAGERGGFLPLELELAVKVWPCRPR